MRLPDYSWTNIRLRAYRLCHFARDNHSILQVFIRDLEYVSVQTVVVVVTVNRNSVEPGACAQIFVCLSVYRVSIGSAPQILRRNGQRINLKTRRANTTNELKFKGQRVFQRWHSSIRCKSIEKIPLQGSVETPCGFILLSYSPAEIVFSSFGKPKANNRVRIHLSILFTDFHLECVCVCVYLLVFGFRSQERQQRKSLLSYFLQQTHRLCYRL